MHSSKRLVAVATSACLFLTGCGAMHTAIKKRNLEVTTQMSQTVWLEPSGQKTVYLQVRNTSDQDMSALEGLMARGLRAKGYTVTSDSDAAYYWIQANVLKAEKMDQRQAQGFLSSGYSAGMTTAALGTGIAAYNTGSAGTVLGVGLASGLAGMAADAMVEDVNYTMVTDLQISERSKGTVTTNHVAALRQGTSGAKVQTSTEQGERMKYQTRVVSSANKVNLKYEEAKPVLEAQLAKSVAGIL